MQIMFQVDTEPDGSTSEACSFEGSPDELPFVASVLFEATSARICTLAARFANAVEQSSEAAPKDGPDSCDQT